MGAPTLGSLWKVNRTAKVSRSCISECTREKTLISRHICRLEWRKIRGFLASEYAPRFASAKKICNL
jgi:hypothetical protein